MIFRALKQEACLERESVSMVPFMAADWQDKKGSEMNISLPFFVVCGKSLS
ncbi:MAG: hypothetical protein ACRDCC_00155 [Culicoidibacterales bacterium]